MNFISILLRHHISLTVYSMYLANGTRSSIHIPLLVSLTSHFASTERSWCCLCPTWNQAMNVCVFPPVVHPYIYDSHACISCYATQGVHLFKDPLKRRQSPQHISPWYSNFMFTVCTLHTHFSVQFSVFSKRVPD